MKESRKYQSGFTLIELLVVIIIVAVLAAVGIPLLTGNVDKAKLTEADAGFSSIRTAMRSQLAEKGVFPTGPTLAALGFKTDDLKGRYFGDADYSFPSSGAAAFCVAVNGNSAGTNAPAAPQSAGLTRSMNQDGFIFTTNSCGGTAINAN